MSPLFFKEGLGVISLLLPLLPISMSETAQNIDNQNPQEEKLSFAEQNQAQEEILSSIQNLSKQTPDKAESINKVAPKILKELAEAGYNSKNLRDHKRILPAPNDKYGKVNVIEQFLLMTDKTML